MLKNYIKIAWRNILNSKIYSFINIFGLTIGISSCILIFIYIQDELSYDKHWKSADRIIRIDQIFIDKGIIDPYAVTAFPLANSLKENFPEIENVVRIATNNHQTISYENKYFNEDKQYKVDGDFLEVFDFELLKGDPKTCLKEPNSAVISEAMAIKFFGDADPIGKILKYPKQRLIKVTGVLKNTNKRSHLNPNALYTVESWRKKPDLKNANWFNLDVFTYVKLRDTRAVAGFDKKLEMLATKILDPAAKESKFSFKTELKSQALSDIYFNKFYLFNGQFESGEKKYLVIFGWVAAFILIIACFNYMNLSTARALKRSKEVGLRKVVGAEKKQLILQFLGESLIITLIALVFSILLLMVVIPYFNLLTDKTIHFAYIFRDLKFWLALIIIILFISLVGGSYPSFYLSRFNPTDILKGKLVELKNSSTFNKIRLRQLLVISQFTISTIILIATIMVYKQLKLMKTKDLGFNKDQVLVLKLPSYLDSLAFKKIVSLKNDLVGNSSIANVATADYFVGSGRLDFFVKDNGRDYTSTLNVNFADYNYLDLLNIKLLEGRNFSKDFSEDKFNFILNESALKFLNWKDPIGKEMSLDGQNFGKVIGIIKDFNYKSAHTAIEPLALKLPPGKYTIGPTILIKINPSNISKTIAFVEQKWKDHFPQNPISSFFLDEEFNKQYKKDVSMLFLFNCFSGLTILISCLGLFGLASFTTEQRVKEIGIRKVLGASISNITYLISKDFMILIVVAIIIASPIAYYFIDLWLQDFAYRTQISLWVFILSGCVALIIAFLSMSFQTIKAAASNPIKSLRTE